jgi:hypothetical protein
MSQPTQTLDAATNAPPPLARRGYMALVVGLAVFLAVVIALRDPFRGYQAEVRLNGPACEAIDPAKVRDWVSAHESNAAFAIATTEGGARLEIRIGRVGASAAEATGALDDLARTMLMEYLPEQHTCYRQTIVAALQDDLNAARAAENAVRSRLSETPEKQLALRPAMQEEGSAEGSTANSSSRGSLRDPQPPSAQFTAESNVRVLEKLQSLKLELARLLADFTDEHPQVQALRRQIASVESEFESDEGARQTKAEIGPSFGVGIPSRTAIFTGYGGTDEKGSGVFGENRASMMETDDSPKTPDPLVLSPPKTPDPLAVNLDAATLNRQQCEQKLETTLASLSLHSPTAAWSAEPARVVARLGGTPRMLPLTLALIAGLVAGVVMFRATGVIRLPHILVTPGDLAAALPLPVVGQGLASRSPAERRRRPIVTPSRVSLAARVAEFALILLAAVCIIAMVLEPSLAGQFPADPLGVVSEIAGRFLPG